MSEKFKCTSCGSGKPLVREVADKSRPPIMTGSGLTPLYHKKLVCGNCGNEWIHED